MEKNKKSQEVILDTWCAEEYFDESDYLQMPHVFLSIEQHQKKKTDEYFGMLDTTY